VTVRERFSKAEKACRAATSGRFDVLTESESRYLAKHKSPDAIRNRIAAAGKQAGGGLDEG
jgi:hypothetical protein